MNESDYAAYLMNHIPQMTYEDVEADLGPSDKDVKNAATRQALSLKGEVIFTGDIAIRVRDTLARLGYKDLRYQGELLRILPEDRRYEDFVSEAIYWYLRELGVKLTP